MYDTVIIGAGMSGLAAGIRLAYYDQRVCILERHTTIGGLNSFYRLRGRNYDVGLHAVTNFTPKGTKKGPLARLLRQLRMSWDEFALCPQTGSAIAFPDVTLRFNNDFELLRSEVHSKFPSQKDNFERLLNQIDDYDDLDLRNAGRSAREVVGESITDPLLVDMLFLPLMYYGSARENDMDFAQFCIMFRSIFCEGFARPYRGVRLILKQLVRKYKDLGGELRLRSGVQELKVSGDNVTRIVLDDGSEIEAKRVLSSAGWVETLRLCSDGHRASDDIQPGEVSFCETISVLDCLPQDLGHEETIVFFNDHEKFHYEKPDRLIDLRSGVICTPNNFQYEGPLEEGMMRVTVLANYDMWNALGPEEYQLAKLRGYDEIVDSACRFVPDFRRRVIETDMFTPTTIKRFTGHVNGAVYGAPRKRYDGTTHLKNLFICGTDQGFMGIIGTIISGISMANQHCLK